MTMDHLNHLSEQIELAQIAAARAATEAADAESKLNQITSRTGVLITERAAVVARRAAGHTQPNDGQTLALIAADLEGLEALQRDAANVLSAARALHQENGSTLAAVKAAYAQHENTLALEALDERAGTLIALLQNTLEERQLPAAALPRDLRDAACIVAHGVALEPVVLALIQYARQAAGAMSYSARPAWKPDLGFHFEVERLHLNDGRLA